MPKWDHWDDGLILDFGCLMLICMFFIVLTITFFTLWVLK